MESVDFTVHDPARMRTRFAGVLDYLARVELEVERNVLELITIMPNPTQADRAFYADVWMYQEIRHGEILDELNRRVDLPDTQPELRVGFAVRALGTMAHFEPVQDVARTIYYLSGASTERHAVLAYNALAGQLTRWARRRPETIINPIKRQEPRHFAFYRMSAEKILPDGTLRPWQVWLTLGERPESVDLLDRDSWDCAYMLARRAVPILLDFRGRDPAMMRLPDGDARDRVGDAQWRWVTDIYSCDEFNNPRLESTLRVGDHHFRNCIGPDHGLLQTRCLWIERLSDIEADRVARPNRAIRSATGRSRMGRHHSS